MKNTKTNKNVFWVIKNNITGEFFNKDRRYEYTKKIQNALLLPSRSIARKAKVANETIYKVTDSKQNGIQLIKPEWK